VPPHIARSLAYAHTSSARKVCCWEKGSKKVVSVTALFLVTTKVIYKRKTKKKKEKVKVKRAQLCTNPSKKKKEKKKVSKRVNVSLIPTPSLMEMPKSSVCKHDNKKEKIPLF
jgi:type IV secretory pathway VirJ component